MDSGDSEMGPNTDLSVLIMTSTLILNQYYINRNTAWYLGYLPQTLITDKRDSKETEFT